ncbi:GTPase activating protein BUD2 [Pichia kudriavzevii]|uniref:GTPase activating protein BUD2 n=2 Tax=Pichia kudriavzevii TaxID=4909 RepID=A0A1V2LL76_PICKU|nr:GTPase activating protein BUD2 [Pichia kudriavzevii]
MDPSRVLRDRPMSVVSKRPFADLYRESTAKHRGTFGGFASWSFNRHTWQKGELLIESTGEVLGNSRILLTSVHGCKITLIEGEMTVKVNNEIWFRFFEWLKFVDFISALISWSNATMPGILSKWKSCEGLRNDIQMSCPVELLVDDKCWSKVDCLLANGLLKIGDDNVDITALYVSEILPVDYSVFGKQWVIYVGELRELREQHKVPSTNEGYLYMKFDNEELFEKWLHILREYARQEYIGNEENRLSLYQVMNLEIIEATLKVQGSLYCEIVMWDKVWFKTCLVDTNNSIFWKEMFQMRLPICRNHSVKILIKRHTDGACSDHENDEDYEEEDVDEIIGTCYTHLHGAEDQYFHKLTIKNLQNQNIGELVVNITVNETIVLPSEKYTNFETMLKNSSMEELITFLEPQVETKNVELISSILVDVYYNMGEISEYFEVLLDYELNESTQSSLQQKSYKYNTIFRGNSLLSKSLERYTLDIGQTYLKHKDPSLLSLNDDFINVHKEEIFVYYDKVTHRKMDFAEKRLQNVNVIKKSDDQTLQLARLIDFISKYDSASSPVEEYQISDLQVDDDFLTSFIKDDGCTFNDIIEHKFSFADVQKQVAYLCQERDSLVRDLQRGGDPILDVDIVNNIRVRRGEVVFDGKGGETIDRIINSSNKIKRQSLAAVPRSESRDFEKDKERDKKSLFTKLFRRKSTIQ